jgi:TRAP-type C4-dicarboxylate transport system substrate-binding protein
MKKLIFTGALLLALSATFTSCREEDKNDAENAMEQTGDAIEEAAQDTEEAAEGGFQAVGEAIDNAVNETEEAGEAVEDAVDEATDDDNN